MSHRAHSPRPHLGSRQRLRTQGLLRRRKAARPRQRLQFPVRPAGSRPLPELVRSPTPPLKPHCTIPMPGPPASALPGGREEGGLRPGSGLGFAAFPIAARWRVSALHSRLAARPLRSAAAQWGGGALEPPEFLPQLLRWASHSPRGPLGGRPQVSPALTPSLHDGHGVLSSPTDRTSAAASHLSGQGQGEGRGSRRPREPPPDLPQAPRRATVWMHQHPLRGFPQQRPSGSRPPPTAGTSGPGVGGSLRPSCPPGFPKPWL